MNYTWQQAGYRWILYGENAAGHLVEIEDDNDGFILHRDGVLIDIFHDLGAAFVAGLDWARAL